MQSTGLSSARYAEFMRTLAAGGEHKVTVSILDPSHRYLQVISHLLLDGQVNVRAPEWGDDDQIGRTARLQFLDPDGTLPLDSSSPATGALYLDRMIRVVYSVLCSFGWVDTIVFTGPVTKVDRDDLIVDVECHGKEHYAQGSAWEGLVLSGSKAGAIRRLLGLSGEPSRYVDVDAIGSNLSGRLGIGREDTYWYGTGRIVRSEGCRHFYDGRGVFIARRLSGRVAVTLREGDGGFITEAAQIGYSTDGMRNAVQVTGAKGSKGKATPQARVEARVNPMSPAKIGRNGRPLVLAEFIEDSELTSQSACASVAKARLDDLIMQQTETNVQTLPIPHLEPWDLVDVPSVNARIRVREFTLPLVQSAGSGKSMTIGTTSNVITPKRKVRRT